ncbi:Sgt2p SCDLUD_000944 [Saccharomycodes ludwigii]|uniref:Sgt2p n=1 Tax=Saccharomycodes ludwigii TaxID=36035 RepID=UPI001E825C71|nr:hypothetical protein SCDLUD_000944 [Saccharomycodes ludwigii]KAH3903318.1 hypothetical protein SCDLUD_000944 [Saccharomycodes ludwigii]
MSAENKAIAALIIDFLTAVTGKKQVSEDSIDSLNVAIDCISESFEIERDDVSSIIKNKFDGRSLAELIGQKPAVIPVAPASAAPVVDGTVDINIDEEEELETKAKAETLKLEGNKAMAARDFKLAVQKYTEAIDTLATNPIYYANRAAAYSSLKEYDNAVNDAKTAIQLDPSYSKGYSRLGFAQYALNKPEEAVEAYKKVLDLEGDKATDVMKRDYETAKKKVESSLQGDVAISKDINDTQESAGASTAGTGAGGLPDMSSLLGGGLSGLLNNPQVMQAAEQMMKNPGALQDMMNNPAIKQMAEKFSSGGGMPSMGDLMNDPALKDMAGKMFGGGKK